MTFIATITITFSVVSITPEENFFEAMVGIAVPPLTQEA